MYKNKRVRFPLLVLCTINFLAYNSSFAMEEERRSSALFSESLVQQMRDTNAILYELEQIIGSEHAHMSHEKIVALIKNFEHEIYDILSKLSEEKNNDNKLFILNEVQNQFLKIRSLLNSYLFTIRKQYQKISFAEQSILTQKMKQHLEGQLQVLMNLVEKIDKQLEMLSNQSTSMHIEQPKSTKKVKEWFKRTFEFYKDTYLKKSIHDEMKELVNVEHQFNNVEKFFQSITTLDAELDSLSEAKPKNLHEIQQLQTKMKNVAAAVSKIEQKIIAYNRALLEAEKDLYQISNSLQLKSERYRESYATLFDKLLHDYTKEFQQEFAVDKAYEALELPHNASTKTILNVDEKNRAQGKFGGLRNSVNILLNPVSRATYDLFLKDYATLLSKNITPEDPDKNEAIKNFLNTYSELAKIEINKDTYDKIRDLDQGLLIKAVQLKDQIGTLKAEFNSLKQHIETAWLSKVGTMKMHAGILKAELNALENRVAALQSTLQSLSSQES